MAWEIFRKTEILQDTNRPTTFLTKGGGLIGYYSYSVIIPDYQLTLTSLLSGDVSVVTCLLNAITVPLVRNGEDLAQKSLTTNFAGTYITNTSDPRNATLVLDATPQKGLYISYLNMPDRSILTTLNEHAAGLSGLFSPVYWQLVPTLLPSSTVTADTADTGQIWRFINVNTTPSRPSNSSTSGGNLWMDYCVSLSDPVNYGGKPFNEVFFGLDAEGKVSKVELPAWQVILYRI